jgi:excisionase family DNA binding protein
MSQSNGLAMEGHVTDKKITVNSAAKILGVSTKTIQRYLAKGRLTRIKEGTRTLIFLPEVRVLQGHPTLGQGRPSLTPDKSRGTGQIRDIVTLGRERYEQILIELGELRKQNQFFMEYKEVQQAKEEFIRRLAVDVEQLRERVRALEMRKLKEIPSAPEDVQESVGERDQARAKGKKPWWQV